MITVLFGFLITPLVIKFAVRFGFVDKPNSRKVHTEVMPRLGGLGIYLSFLVGINLFYFFTDLFTAKSELYFSLMIGGTIIAVIGILDDKLELSAKQKLVGQIFAALVVIAFGMQVEYVNNPFGEGMIRIEYLAIPLSIFWIVGITNAINLVDGLDGLAGGVSGIASLSIAIIAFLSGKPLEGYLALLLCASIVGFLIFNFHPAKIFMGDVGSLFLGYILAVLTFQELKQVTLFGVLVPLMLLAIPVLDTLYAIIRRKVNHRPIFQPDKHHLHHRLIESGLSHKKAVLTIYGISLVFAATAIFVPYVKAWISIMVVSILLITFQILARDIGMIREKKK